MRPSFAILGAGMGGLAVAATLRQAGFGAQVYEQAHRFARIGAGIQMMPNSMKVLLEACPDCHEWAILEREPLPRWSDGRLVLLGDACHPMTPYMAQGAATAIEDAAVRTRCLAEVDGDDVEAAFKRYEAHRNPRTSRIQAISSANTWMKGGNEDTSWLYGYDAGSVALSADAPEISPDGAIR